MEHEAVVESTSSSYPTDPVTRVENTSSQFENLNDLEESNITTSSSTNVLSARRRCWEEAFASESESVTPEPDDLQMENVEVDLCSSTTDNANVNSNKPSKEELTIICEAHPGCLKAFKTVRECEEHYNLRHRHKCITCSKSLPSAHILELHVLETHDTLFSLMAERKPMLACFLESCSSTFWKLEERKEHCLGEHKFPKSFKLWDLSAISSSEGSRQRKKSGSGSNQRVKEKVSDKQKQKSKNKAASKDKTESLQVSSVVSTSSSDNPIPETMEMDRPVSEEKTEQTKSSSKPKKQGSSKSKGHEKSIPTQITFGHSASRAFKPKYGFGLAKPQPEGVGSSSTSKMDSSDIRDVLPTTNNNTLNQVPPQVV